MHTASTAAPSGAATSTHQAPCDLTGQVAQEFVGESRFRQLTLDDAIAAGEAGMAQATDAAERKDPEFKTKAEAAILQHLAASPDRCAPGEELVAVARKAAPVKDARAFGAIFKSLAHRGAIRCLRADLPRVHGRGTSGGKLWALCL